MFEILMFLFENYMDDNAALKMDNQTLFVELEKAGFDRHEIDRALHWLDGMAEFKTSVTQSSGLMPHSIRHFLPEESERLGMDGRGALLYLEQMGILDPVSREIVIDRIMALDCRQIDLGRIKWVVMMVLFNSPEKKNALALMQDMVLANAFDRLH